MTAVPSNTSLRCARVGCLSIRDDSPRLAEEEQGLCARHRQEDRQRRGVCLNCGAALDPQPEMNSLTGKPLRRDGAEVLILVCAAGCGYKRRPRPRGRRTT